MELDPEFMEALNNLGTKYIRMGRPAEAAELFQRATALDPSLPQLHVNLAVALLHLRRPAEAEQEVRKALTGQTDGNPMAKKILGISLAAQGKAAFAPLGWRNVMRRKFLGTGGFFIFGTFSMLSGVAQAHHDDRVGSSETITVQPDVVQLPARLEGA